MLNKIWPLFLISSLLFAIIKGNLLAVNNAIFEAITNAIKLTMNFLGTMSLWCGFIKIVTKTSLINKLRKIFRPILRKIFPEIHGNKEIEETVSMNIIANILGLGNAATPLGLKAMKSLQKTNKNKDELSNSMATLIVLNTSSIQIIPTTIIAIRTSLGSENPTKILVAVWIATICATLTALLVTKILMKKW